MARTSGRSATLRARNASYQAARCSEVADGLAGALEQPEEISHGIHPAILAQGGLARAPRALARRSAVRVELELRTPTRLPEPVEVAAYYVVSETLTNTAKHAYASVVRVVVEAHDGVLALSIRDDGRGGADPAGGSGLVGLADRIDALGDAQGGEPGRAGNDTARRAAHRSEPARLKVDDHFREPWADGEDVVTVGSDHRGCLCTRHERDMDVDEVGVKAGIRTAGGSPRRCGPPR